MKNLFDLTGKKAIVTGGAGGIGSAITKAFHESGVEVTIIDIMDEMYDLADELSKSGPPVHAIKADFTNIDEVESACTEAINKMNGLTILVNNAGTHVRKSIFDHTREDMEQILAVNFTSHFWISRIAAMHMKEQGYGKIINTCSLLSFLGGVNGSTYSATKGALAQLTKSMSNEWYKLGICCNGIAPGYLKTALNAHMAEDFKKTVLMRIPRGKFEEPDAIIGAVLFLASPASDFVSGVILPVDGGYLAR
jgi:2-deoxy-D-gluconate 3-dehydrogenase